MLMQHSIMAGRILTLLQKTNRPASIEEIQDYLKESISSVCGGVRRLVKEGLATIDISDHYPKVSLIAGEGNNNKEGFKYSEFYLSELLGEGGMK